MELLVPTVSDVIFKYTWPIGNYKKLIRKKTSIDSPSFDINVNGLHCTWNLSIRFWKGPEGKRITNPVVLCLNMLNCEVDEIEQAKIRFQFAVFNADVKHWEYCTVSRTILELKSNSDIVSLGYKDLSIVDRHFKKNGDVVVMVKIQIIQCESETHSLAQDMARLLRHPRGSDTKLSCGGTNNTEIPVHSNVISARSTVLANMITPLVEKQSENGSPSEMRELCEVETHENGTKEEREDRGKEKKKSPGDTQLKEDKYDEMRYRFKLDLRELSEDVVLELLRYIYSDHVDCLDTLASQLLSLAERFQLQGLRELCERNLIETITPENVASLLLIADEFGCDTLKRVCLAYCEENVMNIHKSLAWKVMEQVNPELFNEVCEAGIGSSHSSNMDDSEISD